MILNPQAVERLRYEGSASRCHFGGDSTSKQETKNIDARVVGGDDSINLSVPGDSNKITLTDRGAVKDSFAFGSAVAHESLDLALKGVEGAQVTTQQAIASSGSLLSDALQTQAKQQAAFTETIKDIKTSDVRVLVVAGLAVVGLGVAVALKKG